MSAGKAACSRAVISAARGSGQRKIQIIPLGCDAHTGRQGKDQFRAGIEAERIRDRQAGPQQTAFKVRIISRWPSQIAAPEREKQMRLL